MVPASQTMSPSEFDLIARELATIRHRLGCGVVMLLCITLVVLAAFGFAVVNLIAINEMTKEAGLVR